MRTRLPELLFAHTPDWEAAGRKIRSAQTPNGDRQMARKSTTPPVQPILPSNEPSPAVTFSPAALQALIDEVTASRAEMAELKAGLIEANKRKLDTIAKAAKPAPVAVATGKTDKSAANDALCIKLFRKAGFQNVVPHVNVKTFNLWLREDGRRPIEGSKSIKVNNLRLFHVTQTREITAAEKKANAKQQADAIDRHTAKGKAKGSATVHQLNPQ